MIKKLLNIIGLGLNQLRLNTHYLLVAFLLIILPAIFVWVTFESFNTSYENVETAQKQTVSSLHDSISLLLSESVSDNVVQKYINGVVGNEEGVSKIKILKQSGKDLIIEQSTNSVDVGLVEGATELYSSASFAPGDSLIFDFTIDGVRTWQVFRQVQVNTELYFIFSEHSFANIDTVISARHQQTYLMLPIIFIFLMFLAYWILKQTHWQKQFSDTKQKLDEQMLFTNSIAHELRAPLTAIKGYGSFLKESKNLTPEEQKYTENISISTERLIALISDFLEVARIQSGSLGINFKETDVRSVLNNVQTEFDQIAKEKGLQLHVTTPDKPVLASTDSRRLQQILTNLVSNSLKYTKEGSVTIALEQTKLKTLITIKDTGHGISAGDQQKLFKAFTRVGDADNSGITGTGLGMWITKQLVELLHGTVLVESIEGIGTHVKLTFDV